MPGRFLTADEVAQALNVSRRSVYDAVRKGLIPHYRLQRQMRLDLAEVLEACSVRMLSPPPPAEQGTGQEAEAS